MTQTVQAKYENGVLHPLSPLQLSEGETVQIQIETPAPNDAPKPRVLGLHAGMIEWDESFNDPLPDSFWLGEEA